MCVMCSFSGVVPGSSQCNCQCPLTGQTLLPACDGACERMNRIFYSITGIKTRKRFGKCLLRRVTREREQGGKGGESWPVGK